MSLVLDETKLAIAKAIYALRSEVGVNKVTVVAVANRVGISRQAINKTHSEFILAIKNKVGIPKAYLDVLVETNLHESVSTKEVEDLKKRHEQELSKFKNDTLTSLMKNDLTLHKAKLLKNEQVNTQKQLSDKINENKQLELALGDAKSKAIELERELIEFKQNGSSKVSQELVSPDIRIAIEDYTKTKELKDFLIAQDFAYRQAVQNTVDNVKRLCANAIYIFVHSHNASLEECIDRFAMNSGAYVFISLPIILRDKRKPFLKDLTKLDIPIHAIVPKTTEARKNWFRNLNKIEYPAPIIKQFDEQFQDPLVSEGFESVLFLKK